MERRLHRGLEALMGKAKVPVAAAQSLQAITVEGQGHAPLLETGDLPARIAAFLDKAEGVKA